MAKTVRYEGRPTERVLLWFDKNVGRRTHYLPHSIGGFGWQFTLNTLKNDGWELTVEDEKMLMYFFLVK